MKFRWSVFVVPFALLFVSVVLSLVNADWWVERLQLLNQLLLSSFGMSFLYLGLIVFALVVAVYISPVGVVKIGGQDARPILKKWQWFSITLCTTIATGLLFWTTAEPLYHLEVPMQVEDKQLFSMSTMILHWTFNPYSFYAFAAVLFALMFYNADRPFAVSSILHPIWGSKEKNGLKAAIDAICLYSLLAGMTASLGAGILSIAGGLERYLNITPSGTVWGLISFAIVITFIFSAVSGLHKGIKKLSTINIIGFLLLLLIVFFFGQTYEAFRLGGTSFIEYIIDFIPRNLGIGIDQQWQQDWTIFYWANWLAWTPITALFLGRLGVGYTVRTFIRFNVLYPSLFAIVWIFVFSGNTLLINETDGVFQLLLNEKGPESIIYALLQKMPGAAWTGLLFIFLAFISYVTAADSNTSAMSALCVEGIKPENPEAPNWLKILWGCLIGLMAWVMVTYAGLDGVRISSILGGFPVLILMFFIVIAMIKLMLRSDSLTR